MLLVSGKRANILRDIADKTNASKTVLGYLLIVQQQKPMNMHIYHPIHARPMLYRRTLAKMHAGSANNVRVRTCKK